MPRLSIRTDLDNRTFVFGDPLRGEVEWSDFAEPPHRVELRLFHFTSGKGTRDMEIVETRVFDPLVSADRRPFDFSLPNHPPSISGKLVSLTWALELVIDAGDEVSERLEFELSATGEAIDLYRYADGNAEEFRGGKKSWLRWQKK